jgi:DNA topoisomerase-1
MSTIVDRSYVEQDRQRRFSPTPGGWVIAAYLSKYFPDLVDVNFTAKTEDTLDDVSNGNAGMLPALSGFWTPAQKMIDSAKDIKTTEIIDEINENMARHMFPDDNDKCPQCGGKLGLKLSKYGAFIGCANYPECGYTRRLDSAEQKAQSADNTNANHDLGNGILFKIGRFGPYVTDGKKNASAKKYTAETITPEIAAELLAGEKKKAEGVELGVNPATGKPILYYADGRYGAYISSNKVNVSVKERPALEEAAELINNKKPGAKKSWGRKK